MGFIVNLRDVHFGHIIKHLVPLRVLRLNVKVTLVSLRRNLPLAVIPGEAADAVFGPLTFPSESVGRAGIPFRWGGTDGCGHPIIFSRSCAVVSLPGLETEDTSRSQ